MSVWGWLAARFRSKRRSGERQLVLLRERVFTSQMESARIAQRLKAIQGERELNTKRLVEAPTEEDARIQSQHLRGLDTEERALRARWTQVDAELAQHRTSLEGLRNLPEINLRQVEEELRRTAELVEQRSTDQQTLLELEREARQRQEVAFAGFERTVAEPGPDPYLQMWRSGRAPQAEPRPKQEPEARQERA